MRGIAIISVVLSHTGFNVFSGGFIGVDVFFVISGYLLTSIITFEIGNNRFSFKTFYERRARRILPMLYFVSIICLPFSWLLLNPRSFTEFSSSLIGVVSFTPNILFWRETGYFQTAAQLKPLLHTWSLGVEEQFYIILPLIIIISSKKNALKVTITFLMISCFILSQIGSSMYPSANFYLLPMRGWELMIGGLISLYLSDGRVESGHGISQILSILGFVLLIFSILLFDPTTPHPSAYTLIPTIGAGLIIQYASAKTFVGKLLGSKLLVGVGLISYSVYLFHQPIFAFSKHWWGIDNINPANAGLLILLAFVLAYLSWTFIEKPFRNKQQTSRFFLIMICSAFLIIAAGCAGLASDGFPGRFNIPPEVLRSLQSKSPIIESNCENVGDGQDFHGAFCKIGYPSKEVKVAIFGDSHLDSLLSAFDVAGINRGVAIVSSELGGCPPLLELDVLGSLSGWGACRRKNDSRFSYVKNHNIEKVFLVARWTTYTDGEYNGLGIRHLAMNSDDSRSIHSSRAVFEVALKRTIEAYRDIGVKVVVVGQVPQQRADAYNFYYKLYSRRFIVNAEDMKDKVSVPLDIHNNIQKYTRDIFSDYKNKGEIELMILDNAFCNYKKCLIGDKNGSFYADDNHLSNYGASLTVDMIEKYLSY